MWTHAREISRTHAHWISKIEIRQRNRARRQKRVKIERNKVGHEKKIL